MSQRPQSDRINAILRSPHCLSFALPRRTVTLHQLRPSALFFSCLRIPSLKKLTEETFWKVPVPLCVPWLSCLQRARNLSSMAPWWLPPAMTAPWPGTIREAGWHPIRVDKQHVQKTGKETYIQGDPERLLNCGQPATWRPIQHFKKRMPGGNV